MKTMDDPYDIAEQKTFTALTFLQSVYNDPSESKSVRLRAAIEALPFEFPKLAVTAHIDGDFGARLERAVEHSRKVIEHHPSVIKVKRE